MEDLARVEGRISSLAELKRLFSAMEAMAASRVLSAQRSLDAIRKYTGTIEDAICDAVALTPVDGHLPPPPRRPRSTHVVVCSEHGFVGAFNRLVLAHAKSQLSPRHDVVIVGRRGASIASEHGLAPAEVLAMSAHVDGILTTARRLASHCEGSENVARDVCSSSGRQSLRASNPTHLAAAGIHAEAEDEPRRGRCIISRSACSCIG